MIKNIQLKLALFEKGFTQKELSIKTGVPRAYISQAVHGRYVLDTQQRTAISKVLDTSESKLFDF